MLRPKIKEYLDIFPMGDRYQVRGPRYLSVLRGTSVQKIFSRLLPLLDGTATVDELAEKLSDVAPAAVVKALLEKLEVLGILDDLSQKIDGELPPDQARLYHHQLQFFAAASRQGNPARFQRLLLSSKVSIIGDGQLASRILAQCASTGVGNIAALNLGDRSNLEHPNASSAVSTHGLSVKDLTSITPLVTKHRPDLLVLAFDRVEPELLRHINQVSQDNEIPVLHSRLNATDGIVGPLVLPGQTPCLMCHRLRVLRNDEFYKEYISWEIWIQRAAQDQRSAIPSLIPFTETLAGMTTLEIVKRLTLFSPPELYGKFLTIDAITLEVVPHTILRLPRCPSCGRARENVAFAPWA